MCDRSGNELLAKLATAKKRLSKLDEERTGLQLRISNLQDELSSVGELDSTTRQAAIPGVANPRTTSEKIALFRSLFRGRTDVFPKRWENTKKGTAGYSPACANEWVHGICEKPRVKCGDCPNQAFLPVTDQVILEHLQGRYVAGVYPLLKDETCWFLSVDFDKGTWREDVAAFVTTCQHHEVSAAVERSRSGDGAHVWFFFKSPVPANSARKMGCFLITQTMARRHELSMRSYDRFFPNQDTMPRGGFGNLIALPFQDGPRQAGNSVFVDEQWFPYEDQWNLLASIRRMDSAEVVSLAKDASEKGLVIGVRSEEPADDTEPSAPWLKTPARRSNRPVISEKLPSQVRVTLAQLLFVEKSGLPSSLLNQIKRLAAFQNPEFYKKQAMRFPTALTPRVISCAEEHAQHIGLPRGCLDDLQELLSFYDITLEVDDVRCAGKPLDAHFHGELTQVQDQAVRSMLAHDTGVYVAPPGSGKTVVGIHLIARRACNTLVLVHRTPLLEQWIAQLAVFLDLKPKEIGRIGGGKRKPNGTLDVAMIQSLVRRSDVDDLVGEYGHVIVDECHHVPAVSFEQVMQKVRAKFITGLTATPLRRDGHHPILRFQLGPVRYSIDLKSPATERLFEYRLVLRETTFKLDSHSADIGIQEIYRQLSLDENRNELILDDVISALDEGRSPILLTERRDHLELLAERLRGFAKNLIVLRGGMGKKQQRAATEQLASIPDDEERLILATGRFIGEGFDDARLDTLFLAMPVAWRGTLLQYAGRLHRRHGSKREVRIMDYVDRSVPMLSRMFDKRMRGYRAMGYSLSASSEMSTSKDKNRLVLRDNEDEIGIDDGLF